MENGTLVWQCLSCHHVESAHLHTPQKPPMTRAHTGQNLSSSKLSPGDRVAPSHSFGSFYDIAESDDSGREHTGEKRTIGHREMRFCARCGYPRCTELRHSSWMSRSRREAGSSRSTSPYSSPMGRSAAGRGHRGDEYAAVDDDDDDDDDDGPLSRSPPSSLATVLVNAGRTVYSMTARLLTRREDCLKDDNVKEDSSLSRSPSPRRSSSSPATQHAVPSNGTPDGDDAHHPSSDAARRHLWEQLSIPDALWRLLLPNYADPFASGEGSTPDDGQSRRLVFRPAVQLGVQAMSDIQLRVAKARLEMLHDVIAAEELYRGAQARGVGGGPPRS